MRARGILLVLLASGAVLAAEPDPAPEPDPPPAVLESPAATGVVNANRLNVRLRPDTAAPVLGQVKRGDRVVVRKVAASWCEIEYPRTLNIWMSAKLVQTDPEAIDEAAPTEPVAGVVRRSGARLRATPSLAGATLGERSRGDEVAVVGVFGEWLRIVPPADLRAYIHADYVDLVTGDAAVAERDRDASRTEGAGPLVPEAAAQRIALAGRLLRDADSSLEETRRALVLLEEALGLDGLAGPAREAVRRRVRRLLGELPPSRWLDLFEKAEARRKKELETIERRYSEPLDEARKSLDEAPALEFTARGVLRSPATGDERWRLTHGDMPLYELDSRGADLAPFVGKQVGVIGELLEADRPGGVPVIEVRHVEEIKPPACPSRPPVGGEERKVGDEPGEAPGGP